MFKKIVLPLLAAALLVWAIGCSDNPSDPQTDADLPNINSDFGGYTAVDEAPGFGDPDLVAAEGEEEEVDDAMAATPLIQDWVVDPNVLAFHFRAVWGQLCYDSTVTTATDWTGSLTISRGGLLTRRLICWELNQDFLLPRTARELVDWQSTTTVHHDGLAFDLLIPWVTGYDSTMVVDTIDDTTFDTAYVVDTVLPEPFTLTFETGPYTRTFAMEELAALDTVVYVDDADSNAVVFQGYQKFRNVCPRGILSGRWGYDEEGNGIFRGIWHSRFGFADGYVQGFFGVNDDDEQVFYGKWVDRDGRFEGLLAGTYGLHPSVNASEMAKKRAGGWLDGRIYDANESEIGALKGRFKSHVNFPSGWFQARWKLHCAEVPVVDDNLGTLEDAI
ncbi:MAG: hypothetical protein GY867_09530 [bacterium]|nr:hypothetical protein [bacterium]